MLLLIFSAQTGPRLLYILEEIFRYRFAIPYRLTADLAEYRDWQGPRLNYSSAPGGGTEIWIPACSFLFGSGTSSPSPEVTRVGQTPALFPVEIPQTGDFPFDLFAMGFFLLSRYEEYSPALRDEHGRFPSSASLSHKEGFLEIPVWDIWMDGLAEKLRQVFPELSPARPGFSFLPTFDVDQIWAYRHKPVLRQWGGMARDLFAARFRLVLQRLAVLAGLVKDPFDTIPFILQNHRQKPLFFFLLADPGPYDVNHPHRHPLFRNLIGWLASQAPLGIHPSYRSGDNPSLVKTEKERLEQICGRPVVKSRQHFLRLRFPETYRALLDSGILEDYSMGYSDAIGFRAGTAVPFHWYDLLKEGATGLLVTPFQVMDVTLKNHMGLLPRKALERTLSVFQAVQQTGGVFCTIWHNSSFDEWGYWKGWTAVYLELLKELDKHEEF